MFSFKSLIVLSQLALLSVALPTLEARSPIPPAGFAILSTSAAGTGCSSSSSSTFTQISPSAGALTTVFAELFAEIGPGISAANNQKDCKITVTAFVPAGWSFGVAEGSIQLDAGVTLDVVSTYTFPGVTPTKSQSVNHNGPVPYPGTSFSSQQTFDSSVGTSPCGAGAGDGSTVTLEIDTDVRVSGTGTGYGAIDSADVIFGFHEC
ncbi:hypothetical protein CC2G_004910 [Coprinopsis cinerea AmutBmut pab1-1]|nr:hypothetical protein CC2G_004910 [Coprinopsis cinerea AmutBmut pab1-1]